MTVQLKLPQTLQGSSFSITAKDRPAVAFNNYGVTESTITVVGITPATSAIVAGQSVSDMTNFSTMVALSNFATDASGGSISTVDVIVSANGQEDQNTISTTFQADDIVKFIARVTDSTGTVQDFDTSLTTVLSSTAGYSVSISAGRYARITPLDGATGSVSIAVADTTEVVYDGTYAGMDVADFATGTAPFFFSNTTRITIPSGRADETELVSGDILTIYPGLVATDVESTTFSTQLYRDGVALGSAVSGVEAFTYTLTPNENDTDLYAVTTVDDGVNATVTSQSNTITVPQPVSLGPLSPTLLHVDEKNVSPFTVSGVDATGVPSGGLIYLIAGWRSTPSSNSLTDLTLDGVSCDLIAVGEDDTTRQKISIWRTQHGGNNTLAIVPTWEDIDDVDNFGLQVIYVENALGELAGTAGFAQQTNTTVSLNLNTIDGGLVIAAGRDDGGGTGATLTGVTHNVAGNTSGAYDHIYGSHLCTSAETPRTVSYNPNSSHNCGVAIVVY